MFFDANLTFENQVWAKKTKNQVKALALVKTSLPCLPKKAESESGLLSDPSLTRIKCFSF